MKIKGGILITPRDIMLITGADCERSAQKEHLAVRDSLNIKNKRLTIKQYCVYWNFDYTEIIQFLNDNRPN